jgi:hypothetical protein
MAEEIRTCGDCVAFPVCPERGETFNTPKCRETRDQIYIALEDAEQEGRDAACIDCDNVDLDCLDTEQIAEMFKDLENPEKEISTLILHGDISLEKLIKEIGVSVVHSKLREIIDSTFHLGL